MYDGRCFSLTIILISHADIAEIRRKFFNKNRENPFALVGGFASDVVTICFSL